MGGIALSYSASRRGGEDSEVFWGNAVPTANGEMRPESGVSFAGPSIRLEGSLRFSGKFLLNGSLKGEVEGRGLLEIGERGRVEGRLRIEDLVHRGESRGDLRVAHQLALEDGSFHRGDIEAVRVRVSPRARMEGRLRMPGARPDIVRLSSGRRGKKKLGVAVATLVIAGLVLIGFPFDASRWGQDLTGWTVRQWTGPLARWLPFPVSRATEPSEAQRVNALLSEAVRFAKEGSLVLAAERLSSVIEAGGPKRLEARFRLAKVLARQKREEKAIAQLRALLLDAPGHIEGRVFLGELYLRVGRITEAAQVFGGALRRDPQDVVLRRRLAEVNARLRPQEKAQQETAQEELSPLASPAGILQKSEGLLAEKKITQAVLTLQEAVSRFPKNPRLRYRLGAALLAKGEEGAAISELKKVIGLAPDWIDAYLRLGALLELKSRDREAIALYERGAGKNGENPEMLARIALLHKRRGRRDVAHRMLRDLRKSYPKSMPIILELGVLLWESGRPEESKQMFEEALRMDPESDVALNRLAWFHAVEGKNLERGIELSKQSLEIRPATPPYLDTLAELYYRNGQAMEAIPHIQKAIEADPNNRYYRVQLDKFKRSVR